MCVLAIPLEICNGFKRGAYAQMRGFFLRGVYAQTVNLYGIICSFSFSGALTCKLDTCMTCASPEKYPRAWRALAPLQFFFAMRFAFQVLRGERARCDLKGRPIFRGRMNGARKTNKNRAGPTWAHVTPSLATRSEHTRESARIHTCIRRHRQAKSTHARKRVTIILECFS